MFFILVLITAMGDSIFVNIIRPINTNGNLQPACLNWLRLSKRLPLAGRMD